MISLKCLNMPEPCRIKHINLRMATTAGEVCGAFPTSVFFDRHPMWDEALRRRSERRLWSQGPQAKSQVGCVLALHAWTPGQDFLCVYVPYSTQLLARFENEKGSGREWKRAEHRAWHREGAQWMKGNCRHHHHRRHSVIFTPNCSDRSIRGNLASSLIELSKRFGTQTHPSLLSESGFFLIMFQK